MRRMKGRTWFLAHALLILAAAGPPLAATNAVEEYEATAYERLLDAIFGSASALPGIGASQIVWRATVRVSPGLARPEYQLSLTKQRSGGYRVTLAHPGPLSIATRLRSAVETGSPAAESGLAAKIELVHLEREDAAADLAALAADLEELEFPATAESETLMDPTEYVVWIDSGGRMLQLRVNGSTFGRDSDPLIRWVAAAHELCLATCRTAKSIPAEREDG